MVQLVYLESSDDTEEGNRDEAWFGGLAEMYVDDFYVGASPRRIIRPTEPWSSIVTRAAACAGARGDLGIE